MSDFEESLELSQIDDPSNPSQNHGHHQPQLSPRQLNEETLDYDPLTVAFLLGVCYSASVGGTTTLIGTPTNLIFLEIYEIAFPSAPTITFSQWFIFAFPLTIFLILVLWLFLKIRYLSKVKQSSPPSSSSPAIEEIDYIGMEFRKQFEELGPMKAEEKIVGLMIVVLVLGWIWRDGFTVDGSLGYNQFFNDYIGNGTLVLLVSFFFFLIPRTIISPPSSSSSDPLTLSSATAKVVEFVKWLFSYDTKPYRRRRYLLEVEDLKELPWSVLVLIGSGYVVAKGFDQSGLSENIVDQLEHLQRLPPFLVLFLLCTISLVTTEFISNSATAFLLLPVIGSLAVGIGQNPLLFMLPCTVSFSYAFCLPVSTAPNIIVFASGQVPSIQMFISGLFLNSIGLCAVVVYSYFSLSFFFDVTVNSCPTWANCQID